MMDKKEKELIQLRERLNNLKRFEVYVERIFEDELDLDDLNSILYNEIQTSDEKLNNLKIEMDLPDERWDEDEN